MEAVFLVKLQILVVGGRSALDGHHNTRKIGGDHSGHSANELQTVRIAFLGHQAAATGKAISQSDEIELFGAIYDEILGQSGQM